jgi:hypothetical protein
MEETGNMSRPKTKGRIHASVQLDPELLKRASHKAIDLKITRTELINRALRMFLLGCEIEWKKQHE